MQKWNVILAVDLNHGLGMNGGIPWKNKLDSDYFRYVTSYLGSCTNSKKNLLVFGSRTKHQIQNDPKREVITLTKNDKNETENNFSKILQIADNYNKIFICGGDITYKNFYHFADEKKIDYRIYKNFINEKCNVDTIHKNRPFLEEFERDNLVFLNNVYITISDYLAKTKTYRQMLSKDRVLKDPYIRILDRVLTIADTENARQTRNAETYSGFGEMLRFQINKDDISELLPAKTLFHRGVIEELLFFLRGQTDTKILEEKKINIWKGNTEGTNGQMGPMYGYQLRNFGGNGYDQLGRVIASLREDPYSRRHIMTMFNPEQADMGVLYPCHGIAIQFYVNNTGKLNLMMYQRSADVFLGLPFNIFSYGVLLILMAKEINREPGDLIISLGDYHLYKTHKSKAQLQMALHGTYLLDSEYGEKKPKLSISDRVSLTDDVYEYSDFLLENYYPIGVISAEMFA